MKAIFLVRTGEPEKAFEIRETSIPKIKDDEVLIKTEGFGLNFADIVAREGMYKETPPKPCIIGYDVVGRISACGSQVKNLKSGDRVAALTRFGGYAEFAATNANAAVVIPESLNISEACSLATQYCTAYYSAAIAANLREHETVIIHSASGGVGNALLQYSIYKKCKTIATTGSASKVDFLKQQGADHVINTANENFYDAILNLVKKDGVDVIFDALGGSYVKQGIRLLAPAGRIICYGASQMTGTTIFKKIKTALQFGIYHPAQFMMSSRSLIGVNMLHVADKRPAIIQQSLQQVMQLFEKGVFKPHPGKIFPASEIANAHRYLQDKKALGKVALKW